MAEKPKKELWNKFVEAVVLVAAVATIYGVYWTVTN